MPAVVARLPARAHLHHERDRDDGRHRILAHQDGHAVGEPGAGDGARLGGAGTASRHEGGGEERAARQGRPAARHGFFGTKADLRVVGPRQIAAGRIADLLPRDLAQAVDVAQLVVERPGGLGEAVGIGETLGGLGVERVLGFELGDRQLALLLGGAALLHLRDLLQDDALDLRDVLGLELRAQRGDAAAHLRRVAHGDAVDQALVVAQAADEARALGAGEDRGEQIHGVAVRDHRRAGACQPIARKACCSGRSTVRRDDAAERPGRGRGRAPDSPWRGRVPKVRSTRARTFAGSTGPTTTSVMFSGV